MFMSVEAFNMKTISFGREVWIKWEDQLHCTCGVVVNKIERDKFGHIFPISKNQANQANKITEGNIPYRDLIGKILSSSLEDKS